jgi:NAD(P)H-hydrate epimerase
VFADLTRRQCRSIDRIAGEDYGVPSIVLMENAAINATRVLLGRFNDARHFIVACGRGNNGGDGLAIARHLAIAGRSVSVVLADDPGTFLGDAKTNLVIVKSMKLSIIGSTNLTTTIETSTDAIVVDALFGTGLSREPFGAHQALIRSINQSGRPVVAIDVPSGLDCDTGEPLGECVRASLTITFVGTKLGFQNAASRSFTGEVVVAHIGISDQMVRHALRSEDSSR